VDSTYVACVERTASEVIDGEAVVINFDTKGYFGFNASATMVWSMLCAGPTTVGAATEALAEAYQRSGADVHDDVHALLAILVTEGLAASVSDAPVATAPPSPTGPYTAPRVERYGTLEQLMLAGE